MNLFSLFISIGEITGVYKDRFDMLFISKIICFNNIDSLIDFLSADLALIGLIGYF